MNSIEMPVMLWDKTGTVALIWQISGYAVKCVVVIAIAVLTFLSAFCQHPPRSGPCGSPCGFGFGYFPALLYLAPLLSMWVVGMETRSD